jgi:membrane protease YdiL (CAAX protease family)
MRDALALLSRLPTRRSGGPLSSVAVAVALGGLIAIVAVVAAGHRTGGGHAERPSRAFLDYLLSAFLVFMVVGAIAVVYLVWLEREELAAQDDPSARRRHTIGSLFVFLGIVLVLVLAREAGWRPGSIFHRFAKHHGGAPAATHSKTKPTRALPAHEPHFRWVAAAVVIAFFAALVVLAAYLRARSRLAADERSRAAEEVAAALDDSVDDLRAEPDARRAIVAAYARMERALGAVGVPRRPAEAPLEFMARALEGLRASGVSVRRLTELFRIAKFSAHRLGPVEKEQAIEALVAVRDELRSEP